MYFKITSFNYIFYYQCLHQNKFDDVNENNSSENKNFDGEDTGK